MQRFHRHFPSLLLACGCAAQAATPVQVHGNLQVKGTQIVDASGTPTQLVGMSMYWSIWGGEKYYTPGVVAWLASDWKVSVLRAPAAVEPTGGYLTDPTTIVTRVKTIVDAAIANGIYVIVDWHDGTANAHVAQSTAFFTQFAQEYGSKPNLIWEIWNEPGSSGGTGSGGAEDWNDIKGYANQIIPVIRKYSKNLILVGTPSWDQTVGAPAASPLTDPNVAYTLHFYAKSHKQWLRDAGDAALAKGLPLFISECGTTNADGGSAANPGMDTVETTTWFQWAASRKISWANWSVVNFGESSAALAASASTTGGWAAKDLSADGTWVRRQIIAANSNYTTSLEAVPPTDHAALRVAGGHLEVGGIGPEWTNVTVRGIDGRILLQSDLPRASVALPGGARGVFAVELSGPSRRRTESIFVP
jgi:endoglucanase